MSDSADRPGSPPLVPAQPAPPVPYAPTALPPELLAGEAGDGGGQISLSFILLAIRRWWRWTIPTGIVLSALTGALIWTLFEPVFEAQAWLLINSRQPFIVNDMNPGYSYGPDAFVRTQVELIGSPIVLGRVLSNPDVAGLPEVKGEIDPLSWLTGELRVQSVGKSDLYRVTFKGPHAGNASKIVNAVIDEYLQVQEDKLTAEQTRLIQLLEREQQRRRNDVEYQRNRVKMLASQKAAKGGTVGSQTGPPVLSENPLATLDAQRLRIHQERMMLEVELEAVEQEAASRGKPVLSERRIEEEFVRDQRVARLLDQIQIRQDQVVELRALLAAGQNSRQIQQIESEIAAYSAQVEVLRKELYPTIVETFQENQTDDLAVEMAKIRRQIETYNRLEKRIVDELSSRRQEMREEGIETVELDFARAELVLAEEVFDRIAARLEALRTEIRAPSRVELMKRAEPPPWPVEAIPWKQLAAGCLAMLCAPFGLAVVWEMRVRRISEAYQLSRETRLPVVGEVTTLPVRAVNATHGLSPRLERYRHTYQESVDHVRTTLTLSDELKSMQVLAVASAVSREGKTSLASQLAISLAETAAEPVLLIDGDLRAPDLHEIFDVASNPGLAEVLAGRRRVADAVTPTWCANLHFMPAGRRSHNPHALLGNGKLRSLLDRLRPSYRYIVIDAPPVLPASDALIIANAADGTLLSTMRDVSRAPQVKRACEQLQGCGARLVGAVLSGVPYHYYESRYGQYYGEGPLEESVADPTAVDPTAARPQPAEAPLAGAAPQAARGPGARGASDASLGETPEEGSAADG